MGTHAVTALSAVHDAMDRLEWRVRIATDFWGTHTDQIFALHWQGNVAFYREAIAPTSMPGPQHPRRSLPARWTNRDRTARIWAPADVLFEFATDLPYGALDRIEAFRQSGRLYARMEGLLFLAGKSSPEGGTEWFGDIARLMGDHHRVPAAEIRSECIELTRDLWCRDVLGLLRPPGRYVVEISVPCGAPQEETSQRALTSITTAQEAFDMGRSAEVARLCYRALDELAKLGDQVERRYGKFARDRIAEQIKATKSLCNPERHGDQPHHDGLAVDLVLAQHVLAVTSSLAGVCAQ